MILEAATENEANLWFLTFIHKESWKEPYVNLSPIPHNLNYRINRAYKIYRRRTRRNCDRLLFTVTCYEMPIDRR